VSPLACPASTRFHRYAARRGLKRVPPDPSLACGEVIRHLGAGRPSSHPRRACTLGPAVREPDGPRPWYKNHLLPPLVVGTGKYLPIPSGAWQLGGPDGLEPCVVRRAGVPLVPGPRALFPLRRVPPVSGWLPFAWSARGHPACRVNRPPTPGWCAAYAWRATVWRRYARPGGAATLVARRDGGAGQPARRRETPRRIPRAWPGCPP